MSNLSLHFATAEGEYANAERKKINCWFAFFSPLLLFGLAAAVYSVRMAVSINRRCRLTGCTIHHTHTHTHAPTEHGRPRWLMLLRCPPSVVAVDHFILVYKRFCFHSGWSATKLTGRRLFIIYWVFVCECVCITTKENLRLSQEAGMRGGGECWRKPKNALCMVHIIFGVCLRTATAAKMANILIL